jgi:hypothetical protein
MVPRPSTSEPAERTPSVVESVPSTVPPYRPEESANPAQGKEPARQTPDVVPAPTSPAPNESNTPSPPIVPAPEREPGTPGGSSGVLRREAQKPVSPTTPSRPSLRASNVLEGKVISGDNKQPEEGVRLILSNRTGNYVDRVAMSDAFGHYAVRLPDGDWTVRVTMPSGRVYPVSQITISGGQITDNLGRDIPSLTITR